jgi:hypothetical protein
VKRRNLLYLTALLPTSSFASGISKLFGFFLPREDIKVITKKTPIDFQWPTQEPFLFCVHHNDDYPFGNKNLGVDSKHFIGRNMGQDFTPKDGFRMYHGGEVPGFPVHPHRGFETITIVRKGYVDHADSLGASGRYGEGDVQWMTAGAGVQHSEMFPLLHQDRPNTCELFQIWLNLPQKNKMVDPDFKMIWSNRIPKISKDSKVEVTLICGEYEGRQFNDSPLNSWAKDPAHEVNILLVKMQKDGVFKFRASKDSTHRTLYFFEGNKIQVNGDLISSKQALYLDSKCEVVVSSDFDGTEFLFLEAKPIGEPIVQHGPFVMNSRQEIFQTIQDYQRTEFGGWKWPRQDMIHGAKVEKFAKYPDGRVERPS